MTPPADLEVMKAPIENRRGDGADIENVHTLRGSPSTRAPEILGWKRGHRPTTTIFLTP